jgi:hypothetical protein
LSRRIPFVRKVLVSSTVFGESYCREANIASSLHTSIA